MPEPDSFAAVCATTARSLLCRIRTMRAETSCSSIPARICRITSACDSPVMVWLKKSAKAGEIPTSTSSDRLPDSAGFSSMKVEEPCLPFQSTSTSGFSALVT